MKARLLRTKDAAGTMFVMLEINKTEASAILDELPGQLVGGPLRVPTMNMRRLLLAVEAGSNVDAFDFRVSDSEEDTTDSGTDG